MHSIPDGKNGVNAQILADWDHQLGDPERHGWRELRTGADVRLLDVNQPSAYLGLTDEEKAAVYGWVNRELFHADEAGRFGSYGLKHVYQRLTRHYLTNGEMKGAMLVAGYEPVDRYELNWRFRYLADPKLRARSIAADIERGRVT